MTKETITIERYDPGDIIDLSEVHAPDAKGYRELNDSKEAMILYKTGESYKILTDKMRYLTLHKTQALSVKYLRHVDLFSQEAADE